MKLLNKEINLFNYFFTRSMLFLFNSTPNHLFFDDLRRFFLRASGFKIIGSPKVFAPISISPKTKTGNIFLNGNLFINSGARFSAPNDSKIIIEKNCLIASNVCFETVNHGILYIKDKPRGAILGDIHVNEGVWVGINSTILQNVVIGEGAVVAASSVVNKDVDSYSLVGGIPARFIKKTDEIKE